MRLYTKTGDKGETSLYGGARRSKADLRVNAYGEVDELQAVLGLCLTLCEDSEITGILERLQRDGFSLCSQLARTGGEGPKVEEADVVWLESRIDSLDTALPELRTFILQGGSALGAHLHLARTVCRRAERSVVALAAHEPAEPICLNYLNRLSDLLFVLARTANHRQGAGETPWKWQK